MTTTTKRRKAKSEPAPEPAIEAAATPEPTPFPIPERHSLSPWAVFWVTTQGRFLALVAIYPVLSFGIGLGLYLNGWWPYVMLQASIILLPILPITAWLMAVYAATYVAPRLINIGGIAVIDRVPCLRSEVFDLLSNPEVTPEAVAQAWWRRGESDSITTFIDALDDPGKGREFSVLDHHYLGATDTEVSLHATTIAANRIYSPSSKSELLRVLKLGGILMFMGGLVFANWFLLQSDDPASTAQPAQSGQVQSAVTR